MHVLDIPIELLQHPPADNILDDVECIRAGIEWLDLVFGNELWMDSINVETLDVGDSNACIVAQVFSSDRYESSYNCLSNMVKIYGHEDFMLGHGFAAVETDLWIEMLEAKAS